MSVSDNTKTAMIVLATSCITGLFSAYSGLLQSKSDLEVATVARLGDLERTVESLRKEGFEKDARIADLTMRVKTANSSSEVLRSMMEKMPVPAWIQKVSFDETGKPEFRMWYLNPQYEQQFGVTIGRYRGKTSFQVWGPQVGAEFYRADVLTLEVMDVRCDYQKHYPQVPRWTLRERLDRIQEMGFQESYVCKWIFEFEGGLASAGMVLNSEQYTKFVRQ